METTTTTTPEAVVEVGDVFESSWGYDQTNVDFYEVTGFTPSGKSVRLRRIGKDTVPGSEGFMSRKVVAVPGRFIGSEFTKRLMVSSWRGVPTWYVKFETYAHGDLVKRADVANKASYESSYA